ncbi:hypothetical protein ONR57_12420 [Hoyosella sp. YIM 151337]|uniref:hypothetical protein n=1 Tax=Hoyosella sp. YIM 151337 TaxID=2992742 RepID=UPI0022369941|nr:hypothetical protein [Hoyosella sp. YIM 151337]MCW4354105.1 hypothetical protein [Hoyosella sp. YIM 151337]
MRPVEQSRRQPDRRTACSCAIGRIVGRLMLPGSAPEFRQLLTASSARHQPVAAVCGGPGYGRILAVLSGLTSVGAGGVNVAGCDCLKWLLAVMEDASCRRWLAVAAWLRLDDANPDVAPSRGLDPERIAAGCACLEEHGYLRRREETQLEIVYEFALPGDENRDTHG